MNNSKDEINSISFLRGIACLFVALYHLKSSAPKDSIFFDLFKYGAFGVDLFFMISGFVIVIATAKDYRVDSFFIKRIFRIYPPLVAAVLFDVYFNNRDISVYEFIKAIIPLHNDYSAKAPDFGFSFLIVAWSITYELAFYFLFFVSMFLSHKYRALICSSLIALIVILSQIIFNGSFSLLQAGATPQIPDGMHYLNILRVFGCSIMLEFIVGMALAYAYIKIEIKNNDIIKRIFIFLSVIAFMYIIPSYLGGYNRGSGIGGYGAWSILILIVCLGSEKLKLVNWNKRVMFLGSISYSLYLFHIPVHGFIKQLNNNYFNQISNVEIRAACSMLFELSASILVAYMSYILIEKTSVKLARNIIHGIGKIKVTA